MELIFGENGVELVHEKGNWNLKTDVGFSPVESLVASVGACGMYVFEAILKGSKVEHEFSTTKVSFEVDEAQRVKPVKTITVDYYIKVDTKDRERAERLVELVPKSCPVMRSLSTDVTVNENIHYV